MEHLHAECNLVYARPDGKPQYLDLYIPSTAKGPFPLLVWFHGGGWQDQSRNTRYYCNATQMWPGVTGNYAYASVDYRLTDVARFPAQIEDCKAAIRWLRAHAAKYNLDPSRIGVWGVSAGGHLVALLGTAGEERMFDVGEYVDVSSRVQAVCDLAGPTDFLATARTPGADGLLALMNTLLGGNTADIPEKAKQASPVTFVSKETPPFLIIHGAADPSVPPSQAQLLHDALRKAGVEAKLHLIPDAGHSGPAFESSEVIAMMQSFFDLHLKV